MSSIFDTATSISMVSFFLCVLCALAAGIILAAAYTVKTRYTQSFVATLAILPAIVCVVIMMVNGNIGAGVAVAGAFSLVRFRSAPGTAKEIGAIFIAMGVGLVAGMGYLALTILCAILFAAISVAFSQLGFGLEKKSRLYKTLHITIPEDLDYTGIFEDLLEEYTSDYELLRVKTTNLGSLFKLTYRVTMKAEKKEKDLIDQLRCRNGNLEIMISRQETFTEGL